MNLWKWASAAATAVGILLCMAAGPAVADAVYISGPSTGKLGAYVMSNGFSIEQPFTPYAAGPVDAISLGLWTVNGASLDGIAWDILAPTAGGISIASGVAAKFRTIHFVGPEFANTPTSPGIPGSVAKYSVVTFRIPEKDLPGIPLALRLQAFTSGGPLSYAAWDVSSFTPSGGRQLLGGNLFQETPLLAFALLFHDPNAPSAAPEPSAWALAILGFSVAGARLRRSRRRAVAAA